MRRCVFLVGFCLASPVLADSLPPVRVLLRGCNEFHEAEVERVLAAELRADTQPNDTKDPTWIVARCEDGRVIIEVSDPVSRKTLRRSFDLGTARASARARLIGIAASELVLASWAELAMRPSLRVEPEGRAPDSRSTSAAVQRVREAPKQGFTRDNPVRVGDAAWPTEPVDEAERKPSWYEPVPERLRFVAIASTRAFVEHDGALWGGGVRVGDEPLVATSWAADAIFESGSVTSNQRTLHVETWTLGGMLYFYGRSRMVTVRAGAGLRLGVVTTSLPDDGNLTRVITPWGWPMLALSTSFRFGGNVVLELSAESSYVAIPVFSGALGSSINGIWVGGQVGIGVSP